MTTIDALSGPALPPASEPTTAAVVMLHGYGSDGNDLIGLAPYFAQTLPHAVFYSPHGLQPLDGMSFGGRQWFSLRDFNPELLNDPQARARFFAAVAGEIEEAAAAINSYLDQILVQHKLAPNRLVLLGFSQGTMMALHVGLRRKAQIAGIVGYSGELMASQRLSAEISSKPPVVLVHGADDPLIPASRTEAAAEALKAAGVSCRSLIVPGVPHTIDQTGVDFGATFMQSVIG